MDPTCSSVCGSYSSSSSAFWARLRFFATGALLSFTSSALSLSPSSSSPSSSAASPPSSSSILSCSEDAYSTARRVRSFGRLCLHDNKTLIQECLSYQCQHHRSSTTITIALPAPRWRPTRNPSRRSPQSAAQCTWWRVPSGARPTGKRSARHMRTFSNRRHREGVRSVGSAHHRALLLLQALELFVRLLFHEKQKVKTRCSYFGIFCPFLLKKGEIQTMLFDRICWRE